MRLNSIIRYDVQSKNINIFSIELGLKKINFNISSYIKTQIDLIVFLVSLFYHTYQK